MMLGIERASVGEPDAMHWGLMPDGTPVLLLVASGARVQVAMTDAEVDTLAKSGIYLVMSKALAPAAAPAAGEGASVKKASGLVGLDGMPL